MLTRTFMFPIISIGLHADTQRWDASRDTTEVAVGGSKCQLLNILWSLYYGGPLAPRESFFLSRDPDFVTRDPDFECRDPEIKN